MAYRADVRARVRAHDGLREVSSFGVDTSDGHDTGQPRRFYATVAILYARCLLYVMVNGDTGYYVATSTHTREEASRDTDP
jgi:hypothetical protein